MELLITQPEEELSDLARETQRSKLNVEDKIQK